jgi:glycine cleavage system aminomethyltransferase T
MFTQSPAYPYDPTVGVYCTRFPRYPQPLEYSGWRDESMAWKESCAIFAGLYPSQTVAKITGPDVVELLSYATTSTYDKFAIGRLKHTIMCDDNGWILAHGIIARVGEQQFHTYGLTPWLNYAAVKGNYEVAFEDSTLAEFNFQCTGPRILEVLETATGDDLHDISFMGHRTSSIDGHEVRLFRMGMAGTLGYEVHGPIDRAWELYAKIVEAGQPFGIRRMGWTTYMAQLPEAGYPQQNATLLSSSIEDKGFFEYVESIGGRTAPWRYPTMAGSSGSDYRSLFRNPLELGWHRSVSFTHGFRGKAALQKEAANPTRKLVTLVWNVDDLLEVYASLFRKDAEPYRFMDFPIEPVFQGLRVGSIYYQDKVLKEDKPVGCSNGRVYSLYAREMISMGLVDVAQAGLGNDLEVLWGHSGTKQKKIRVVVGKYPYLDLPSNQTLDLDSIPRLGKSRENCDP